ncbi:hypothetical protein HN51_047588 [Arachis hypogaea]|nr:uncharacterized protein LOC107625294 [Arachis ipaensis]XP_025632976.1 uncharacterized protein LOC112727453 [Arachis hypogaea]QHO23943.1 hypothetical protein DS421_12g367990 [Arachis hypogaea]
MVMRNPVIDPQDQRKTSNMEDSSAMTIEFLRARLLSERSISRSARQRAEELAEKVIELEEELRKITLQRKMAEKATADVLAILENQGISDISGEFDLGSEGSDHDITCDSSVSNGYANAAERSTSSKVRRHASEELSGSNVDPSPSPGRSLSWKGRLDPCRSLEKYKTSHVRRRNSLSSSSSSARHLAKSCRRIKHKETSSENEVASSSEGFLNDSNGEPCVRLRMESKTQEEDESDLMLAINKNHDLDGCEREDMEKALEHRAQLIDQYEAMEKAQREWEDKFRENNTSTPDSFDMGNHSDITEERDERKAQIPCSANETTSCVQPDKSENISVYAPEKTINAERRDDMPNSFDDTGYNNQSSKTVSTSGMIQEISHSLLKAIHNHSQENQHSQTSDSHNQGPSKHEFPNFKPTDSSATDVYQGLPLKDSQMNKNSLSELGVHKQFHEFSVLESLKHAKLSLQEEISKLPLVKSGNPGKDINPLATISRDEDNRYDIPVGVAGLFRVPTDISYGVTAGYSAHDSTARFKLHRGRGISGTWGGQLGADSYQSSMFSANNQSLATQFSETFSTTPSVPSVPLGNHVFRTHPISASYQIATRQMSFDEGPSKPYSSSIVDVPPAYDFSFHGDHLR